MFVHVGWSKFEMCWWRRRKNKHNVTPVKWFNYKEEPTVTKTAATYRKYIWQTVTMKPDRRQPQQRKNCHVVFLPVDVCNKTTTVLRSQHGYQGKHLNFIFQTLTTEAILSSFGKISDSYNLNITDSTCQSRRGGKKIQTRTNLTQIYKNMPLDSYQQLRTVGALFTEKKAMYTNIYNNKDFFHI